MKKTQKSQATTSALRLDAPLYSGKSRRPVNRDMKITGCLYLIGSLMQCVSPAVADLIEDLHQRVMVVCIGELGRTPKINENTGRDHWRRVMSVVLAGGGLRTGQVIGSSGAQAPCQKNPALSSRERVGRALPPSRNRHHGHIHGQLGTAAFCARAPGVDQRAGLETFPCANVFDLRVARVSGGSTASFHGKAEAQNVDAFG